MKGIPGMRLPLFLTLAVTLASCTSAFATLRTFSWSGGRIVGEREDFFPTGWASFEVSDFTLTIILTNTTSQKILATGEVLTGLVFDINNDSVILTPVSAMMQNSVMMILIISARKADLWTVSTTALQYLI